MIFLETRRGPDFIDGCGEVSVLKPLLDALDRDKPKGLKITVLNQKNPTEACLSMRDACDGDWILSHNQGLVYCQDGGCVPDWLGGRCDKK
jgi:hypothetical protein